MRAMNMTSEYSMLSINFPFRIDYSIIAQKGKTHTDALKYSVLF